MARTFKAVFNRGCIEPSEPVDFPEGAELIVTAEETNEPRAPGGPHSIWAGYDPEKVRTSLREDTGILTTDEAETLISDLYRARAEGSRPPSRP